MKRTFIVIMSCLFSLSTFAFQPIVRNFTRNNYKAGTQNWDIAQDKSNIMYFANNSGLLVFDGKNWQTYPIKNLSNVRSVLYGSEGKFYVSSYREFGFFQEQPNGKFEYKTLIDKLKNNTFNSNELFNIHEGVNKVYFQAEKSVIEYDRNNLKNIFFGRKIDASAVINNLLFVSSAEKGVFMLNGNMFVMVPGSEILKNKRVCSILPFKGNKVLFVTSFDGLYIFDGITVLPYKTSIDKFLSQNQVFCATSNQKQLVFGTVQLGIAVLNIDDGHVIYVNTFSGLQNNTVLSVAFDNQQNLWLGLDKGIDYVMLNSPIMNLFGANNLYGTGYTSLLKDGIMYYGTNQGLYTSGYPFVNSPYPLQLKLIKGMEGQVWCLNDIDNTIFCGNDQGTTIIYPHKIVKINNIKGTWAFKRLRKHPNLILGCSYSGFFILKKTNDEWNFSHTLKGNFNEASDMFEEDDDENIWFSHWQRGLFKLKFNAEFDSIVKIDLYDSKKGFPTVKLNTLFRIGNEIIFSSEMGLFKYDKKTDSMVQNDKWNNLFDHVPGYMRLHETKSGDVWCISGRFVGLAIKKSDNTYQLDSLTYRMLQSKIILGFENFNEIDSKSFILGTEDGFSLINPSHNMKTKNKFNVFLSNVMFTNESDSSNLINSGNWKNLKSNSFSHYNNSLRFEYIAPEYRNDGLVQYSYMLENYDDKWSNYSSENVKEYTQLPKGSYVFRVRARNILESEIVELTYNFKIRSAWYESYIAIIIYVLIIIFLIIRLNIWVNSRSLKGAVEMERLKEIELKEQRKIFDEETSAKKREIKELKNQQLQYELRHKSQELASSTMNVIQKNEMLYELLDNLAKASEEVLHKAETNIILSRINRMERKIKQNIESENNWKRFEENFDIVYENYLKRLALSFPGLNVSDKKLCAYIKMDLSTKEIAPLLNTTIRSVEMNRYRLRKKMGIEREINLSDFLQNF